MTEAEWLQGAGPQDPFEFAWGRMTDRKLRLFAVACCRIVWPSLKEVSRTAVKVAERFADGLATGDELVAARAIFQATASDQVVEIIRGRRYCPDAGGNAADENALWAAKGSMWQSMQPDLHLLRDSGFDLSARDYGVVLAEKRARRHRLLYELVGPQFFRPVALDPAWRTATVVALAESIYAERTFDRLPILADALEEAGCTSAELLNHCRQPGEHVRGCWAVDLVLGKA